MKIINKQKLFLLKNIIEIPIHSKILTIQLHKDVPCIWYEFEENEDRKEKVYIEMFGIGHLIPNDMIYVATIQLINAEFVAHFYMKKIL